MSHCGTSETSLTLLSRGSSRRTRRSPSTSRWPGWAGLIDRLVVYPERMRQNLESLGGLVDSQRVLLALTQAGMSREDAYHAVQRNAMAAWDGKGRFSDLLKHDPDISRFLDPQTIDGLFDPAYHLKHVNTIF